MTMLSQKKIDHALTVERLVGREINAETMTGEIAKQVLRATLFSFIKSTDGWTKPYKLEHDRYKFKDNGSQIVVSGAGKDIITTYDAALAINGRPVIVDIRIANWPNLRERYFSNLAHWERKIPLDDVLGEGNYDRVLAVPFDSPSVKRRDEAHIVRIPYTREQFKREAEQLARQYAVVKQPDKAGEPK
jgi:hypothetical protein